MRQTILILCILTLFSCTTNPSIFENRHQNNFIGQHIDNVKEFYKEYKHPTPRWVDRDSTRKGYLFEYETQTKERRIHEYHTYIVEVKTGKVITVGVEYKNIMKNRPTSFNKK